MGNIYFNYINGKWVPSCTNETYASINPANTEEVLGYFQQSNEEDVESAITSAENAFKEWANTAAPTRGDVLFKLIQLLEEKEKSWPFSLRKKLESLSGKPGVKCKKQSKR